MSQQTGDAAGLPTICLTLGRWVAELDTASLADSVRAEAKLHLLDTLGALLAGSREPEASHLLDTYTRLEGDGPVYVMPKGPRLPLLGAVACQAALTNLTEFDDVHARAALRPGALVVPVILALAQTRPLTGERILAALVAGYEVGVRIGAALDAQALLARGLWPSSVSGPFAAAAAAAKLIGLSPHNCAHALAIAGLSAGGLVTGASEGPTGRHLVFGGAARAGAAAALAAEAGMTGPMRLFEEGRGFMRAFSFEQRVTAAPGLEELDHPYGLSQTSFKPYPCARQTHTALDACAGLIKENRLAAAEITSMTVSLPPTSALIVDKPEPPGSRLAALASIQFLLATFAVRGRVDPDTLSAARTDGLVLALQRRIQVAADPSLAKQGAFAACLRISGRGSTWERTVAVPSGDPAAPLPTETVRQKFQTHAEPVLGTLTAVRVQALVAQLDELADAGPLLEALCSP